MLPTNMTLLIVFAEFEVLFALGFVILYGLVTVGPKICLDLRCLARKKIVLVLTFIHSPDIMMHVVSVGFTRNTKLMY